MSVNLNALFHFLTQFVRLCVKIVPLPQTVFMKTREIGRHKIYGLRFILFRYRSVGSMTPLPSYPMRKFDPLVSLNGTTINFVV